LHLERTDVDTTVQDAIKPRAALVIQRRWRESRVARIDCRAAGVRAMSAGWSAVILQGTQNGIRIDLIARGGQIAAAVIAAEIVTK